MVSCLNQARQIHAILMKKADEALVGYLTQDELRALLDAPNRSTLSGIRDRAMLHLAFAAGLRVSELVGLRMEGLDQATFATVHVMGKGRRERVLPLWKETVTTIKAWLSVRPCHGDQELFLNAAGHAMTRSGFEVHPREACSHGRAQGAINRHKARDATRPAPYLRHPHTPSDRRHSEGLPLARSCNPSKHGNLPACRPDREVGSACCERPAYGQSRSLPRSRSATGDAAAGGPNQKLCRVKFANNGGGLSCSPPTLHNHSRRINPLDRDRGVSRDTAPPTPPGIRVRTSAVRMSYASAGM